MTAIQGVVRCATDHVRWSFVHCVGIAGRGNKTEEASDVREDPWGHQYDTRNENQ